jgi:transposase
MNLVELLQTASSEEKAEEFLREKGILKTFDSCPFCHAKNIGKIRRNFYKCYKCKKEWSVRKDSILEYLKIPFSKFILAVKLFILEAPAHKAHKELDLATILRTRFTQNLDSVYINLSQKMTSFYQEK